MNQVKILVLGYSTRLSGGVSKVTNVLINNISEMELHPIMYFYRPRLLSIAMSVLAFITYLFKIVMLRDEYKIIQVIVGSPGDTIRTLPFILLANRLKLPVIIQFHTEPSSLHKGIQSSRFQSQIIRAWESVYAMAFLSEKLSQQHCLLFNRPKKSIVIHNALPDKWLALDVVTYGSRQADIVYFGRWSKEKGVSELTSAMEELRVKATCELYTNAPPDINYRNCIFNTWVDENSVIIKMQNAKIVVLPSHIEAFPTVLLEAAACGTPFVATDVGGVSDIINESKAGLLVKPCDVEDLREKIEILLTNVDVWNECSRNGKQWIGELDVKSIASSWRNVYKEALD